MPKKKAKSKSSIEDDIEAPGMEEVEPSEVDDGMSYADSGNTSDILSQKTRDGESEREDESDVSSVAIIDDPKELMKKMAKERLRKCLIFMKEFWKIILFLLQTGVIGGVGLLAYYMEFQDIFPRKHTVFNCDDTSIGQHMNASVFEHFIFGENIDEQWVFLFSWMAPPGIMIAVEFFYSMHTGCALSNHMRTPLILRRTFRFIGAPVKPCLLLALLEGKYKVKLIVLTLLLLNFNYYLWNFGLPGNYFFGVMGCLVISKSIKLFTATPRPYFLSVCQPNVTFCMEATEEICTNTNVTELNDARTSFPSMAVGALSFACFFTGAYLHQMIKRSKAFVLQPMASTLFLIISLLGASIELGVKRSHWYDVLAGFALGSYMAVYQVTTLNFFVENFQPPLPMKRDDVWVQTDPIPEPESDDEYPYEDIMMGKLPKRKNRGDIEDNSCFHRATSFDNSFQLDMARSMKMFKTMGSMWAGDKPPTLSFDHSVYEQGLEDGSTPRSKRTTVSSKNKILLDVPHAAKSRKNSNASLSSTGSHEEDKPSIKKIFTSLNSSSPMSQSTDVKDSDSVLQVTITSED